MHTSLNDIASQIERPDLVHAFLDEPQRKERTYTDLANLESSPLPTLPRLMAIKDLIHVEGFKTRAGLPAPIEFSGDESSVVSNLKQRGYLIAGKTALDQLAYDSPPPTLNPLNQLHTPGGSSFGSAAAVAADLASLGIGTQTSSSIIAPAAFCGLLGYKPSTIRSRTDGLVAISPSLDVIGFLAKSLDVIQESAPSLIHDWNSKQADQIKVIGVPGEDFFHHLPDYGWRAAYESQIVRLKEQGFSIKEIVWPWTHDGHEKIYQAASSLIYAELAEHHGNLLDSHSSLLKTPARQALEFGLAISPQTRSELRNFQAELKNDALTLFFRDGIDAIATPSQLGPAPLLTTGRTSWSNSTLIWSFLGLPSLSLPAGTVNQLPVGLQITGKWGEDERLIGSLGGNLGALDFSSIAFHQDVVVPTVSYS